ncbi:ABC transporter ATP-binding protein/permease [Zwartia sp.]|uniref:ABC transporter ATP-binding protein/permease n=1 Tax=Zwartia sp. TaxID=2978004 RepID=UPI003BAFB198
MHEDKQRIHSAQPPAINRELWLRFLTIAKPYWTSDKRWSIRAGLGLLIVLLLLQTISSVMFNRESGEFISALADQDGERFWGSIWRYGYILTAAIPVYSYYYFLQDTLALRWRKWLTDQFMRRYFRERAFYQLGQGKVIDNPDQRIAEDINTFTGQSLFFATVVVGSVIQIIAFGGVLWSISPNLIYFLIGYSAFSSWFTAAVFGKPLIGLNFLQLQREADFRFGLVRVREYAEPIAFYDGEVREISLLQRMFSFVFNNQKRVLRWKFKLNLFQFTHTFLTAVIPTVIIANDVLSGRLEVGLAVQAAGAFAAMLIALTVIVNHFEGLSRFSAVVERLYTFSQALGAQPLGLSAKHEKAIQENKIVTQQGPELTCHQLSICTPTGERTLIKQLNLSVSPNKGLMIVGESGTGKSSLLRVIAGLWSTGSGEIVRPSRHELLFLPQQPYHPLGDLRCQLTYPHVGKTISDEEILHYLDLVNLSSLTTRCGGLGGELDWTKVLSIGEQQRLSFARALLTKPRYLLLDESTSALDAANESRLYAQLSGLEITPISVSHRQALLHHHHEVLVILGDSGWRMEQASEFKWDG